jgi:hypothetical protein
MTVVRISTNRDRRRLPGSGNGERGSALLEYALMLPLVLLLMLNAANFAPYLVAWITLNDAARAATEYQIYNGAAVGQQTIPTVTNVEALVTAEMHSLHNSSTVKVEICSNNSSSGTAVITCSGTGAAFTPTVDPEPTHFVSTGITITYTFQPIFPSYTLPIIKVPLTAFPTATCPTTAIVCMSRTILMRNIQ